VLSRRIEGVLRQYGPLVAFLTTEVLLGNIGEIGSRRDEELRVSEALDDQMYLPAHTFEERLARFVLDFTQHNDWYSSFPWTSSHPLPLYSRGICVRWRGGESEKVLSTSRYDRIVAWLALQIHRHFRRQGADFDLSQLIDVIGTINDWANETRPNIMPMEPHRVEQYAIDWHAELHHPDDDPYAYDALAHDDGSAQYAHMPPVPGTTVYADDEGWTLHRLDTREQLKSEGCQQGICVGGAGYIEAVAKREMIIYSLRDEHGSPHVTIEVRPNAVDRGFRVIGYTVQVKGRGNELIRSHKLCLKLQAAFEHVGIEPHGKDWQNGCLKELRDETAHSLMAREQRELEATRREYAVEQQERARQEIQRRGNPYLYGGR
jgi:hypothetical protein